jgi:hypothetical protein
MITREYKEQLVLKHQKNPWGGGGKSWVPLLDKELNIGQASSILDFGCGRHTFKEEMNKRFPRVEVHEYDPGVLGFDTPPQPGHKYDVIVCTDVMEHVEDEFTIDTLKLIESCVGVHVFFNIVTTPCSSTLPDGRNTHINLKTSEEWQRILRKIFVNYHAKIYEFGSRFVISLTKLD